MSALHDAIVQELAIPLAKLQRPVSSQDRDELRAIIARVVRHLKGAAAPAGPATHPTIPDPQAAFLAAAEALARQGWDEMRIRALLDDEAACLDRSHARHSNRSAA